MQLHHTPLSRSLLQGIQSHCILVRVPPLSYTLLYCNEVVVSLIPLIFLFFLVICFSYSLLLILPLVLLLPRLSSLLVSLLFFLSFLFSFLRPSFYCVYGASWCLFFSF